MAEVGSDRAWNSPAGFVVKGLMKTRVLSLADVSPLEYEISTRVPSGSRIAVLVVSFVGKYRYGSEGEPDARLMEAVISSARIAYRPDAIVLDFIRLDYEWGDDLGRVVSAATGHSQHAQLPVTAAIGSRCWAGWSTFAPLFAAALAGFWFNNVGEAVLNASRQAQMNAATRGFSLRYQTFIP